jgi:hypothetical protein
VEYRGCGNRVVAKVDAWEVIDDTNIAYFQEFPKVSSLVVDPGSE